jgi:hypothetical protein
MSFVDRMIAAATPPESEEARIRVRSQARRAAPPGGWLSIVLDHHGQIEASFFSVKTAPSATARLRAQKALSVILNAHSIAEELVLYPALASTGEEERSDKAFTEQFAIKVRMAALEKIDPMSPQYLDKLEHIRDAVAHHMLVEETTWFLELQQRADGADDAYLTMRYLEEFVRYCGGATSAPRL